MRRRLQEWNELDLFLYDENPSDIVIYFKSRYVFADGNESALTQTLSLAIAR